MCTFEKRKVVGCREVGYIDRAFSCYALEDALDIGHLRSNYIHIELQ